MKKETLSPNETDGVSYRRVKGWQMALAMMQAASIACFFMAIGYVSYAANLGFGISLVTIGVMMTVARIFDGITDPLIAIVIDKVNTRFGKLRLFMIVGWVIMSLTMKLMYDWCCGKGHSLLLFAGIYLLYYIGYTFFNMAGMIVPPVMTNDPKQRPMVTVWSTLYNYLIGIILSIFVTMILLPRYGNTYTLELLSSVSTLVVIVSGIFLLLSMIGLSPIDKPENFTVTVKSKEEKPTFRDYLDLLAHNRALTTYIFAATSDKLATNISGQSIISTILYGIIIGNMQLSAILNIVAIVPILIFATIGGKYTGKHGSKESLVFWTWISIVVNALLIVLLLATSSFQMAASTPAIVAFVILTMVANAMRITVSTATGSMMADVIDYEAFRSGKYIPGAVSGVYSFIDKLVSSLGAVIATFCVSLVGYTSTIPQPSDPKTFPVVIIGVVVMYVFPIIGWLCTLIAMRFSPISKEKMVEVQKTIAERKAADS